MFVYKVTSIARLPDHVSSNSNKQPKKKKVKLSKELACQLQIILTDEDNDSSYEQVFEHWEEVMSINSVLSTDNTDVDDISESSISSSNSDDDNDDDDDDDKQTIKTASTLVLNPDLNRSIHLIQEEEDSRATRENNKSNKPLPLLQFDDSKKDVQRQQHQQQQKSVTGLKRLFSIGNSNSKKDKIEEQFVENRQYHVLRIFAGNINVGAMFATVAVTPDMNADQLLKLALQKFHIPLLTDKSNTIEYYLTVKSMDSGKMIHIYFIIILIAL